MQQALPPGQGGSGEVSLPTSRVVQVWRPVQYLGAKTRLIDRLTPLVHTGTPGAIVDLFSGSSVISQHLSWFAPVIGMDDSSLAGVLFEAGVRLAGRKPSDELRAVLESSYPSEGPTPERDLAVESEAVGRKDVSELIRLYRTRNEEFNGSYSPNDSWWRGKVDGSFPHTLEAHYGGHYFGFRQARELDWIASRVRALPSLTDRAIGLGVLLATASSVVASPGKHFAQPLNMFAESPTTFVRHRLVSDRSRSVKVEALRALESFLSLPRRRFAQSSEFVRSTLPVQLELPSELSSVYADPPYTTDQYSRYYHVLNTISSGERFALTSRHGIPTKGRYPQSRTESVFSNPAKALEGFRELTRRVASVTDHFVLSYSSNVEPGSRTRTVSLSALREVCTESFERVIVVSLAHSYRPLQPKEKAAASATELAIVCDK